MIKLIALPHHLLCVLTEHTARVVAVDVIGDERRAPLEWAHVSIIVAPGVPSFTRVDQAFEQIPIASQAFKNLAE
jgi:hypothetical protein